MYAVVAPSISSQFVHVKVGQVITALKELGFCSVIEAALGADMVAYKEARELAEKGFLTSSCCPAFVTFIEKSFPNLKEHISHNYSPMAELGRFIKRTDPTAKVIFIGPCTAKKAEIQREDVKGLVDVALTFEELQALFDSKNIELEDLEETPIDQASYFGRVFARSGGLTEAMAQGLKELGSDIELKPETCNGIEMCRVAMLKKSRNLLQGNFVEGMACNGGCIGGAGALVKFAVKKDNVDKYAKSSGIPTITDSVNR